jgi:two-component system CheB/CheR fusion protein
MTLESGRLRLHRRIGDTPRKPIDVFLSSLAEDRGEYAVGIVLSGGGTDGTIGIKAVKERGGLTVAQGGDGSAPAQTGMPDAAIAAGVVDLVVPAEEMADRLVQFARHVNKVEATEEEEAAEVAEGEESHRAIYCILLNQIGHDFSGYKEKTFMRRVRRRMQVVQIDALDQYVDFLRANPDEASLLFRDPDAFKVLEEHVVPRLFEGKGASESVRT